MTRISAMRVRASDVGAIRWAGFYFWISPTTRRELKAPISRSRKKRAARKPDWKAKLKRAKGQVGWIDSEVG